MLETLSPYLLSIILAWTTSEIVKGFIACYKEKNFKLSKFLQSGGMPSAHSATVTALATTIGFIDGMNSSVFAVSVLLAAIIMFDAMRARRATGDQGRAINSVIEEAKLKTKKPFSAKGHKPIEVIAGALWGIIVALSLVFIIGG